MRQWTEEQYPIITTLARLVKVNAFAGTGKTTTLVGYAENHPDEKILYIAYNTEVAAEGKRRFPRNAFSSTSHGLAYGPLGSKYSHKLCNNIRLTDVAKAMNTSDWSMAKDVVGMLNSFLSSPDTEIAQHHLMRFRGITINSRQIQYAQLVMRHANSYWNRMCDLQDLDVKMSQDGYLKAWLLTNPDMSRRFHTILLDEAQDTTKLLTQFVRQQYLNGCKVIFVGDRHQQLYRFRGAENALDEPWLKDAEVHTLSKSFRFGWGASHVANTILALKGEKTLLQGFGQQTQIKSKLPDGLEHRTYLYRTVAGVIDRALMCLPAPQEPDNGERVYWVGGIKKYNIQTILDMYWFSLNQTSKIKNFQLTRDYKSFQEYAEIADQTEDPEMVRIIKILKNYGDSLPDLIRRLEQITVEQEMAATVTLSTGHSSKGLEWPYVQLGDDFTYDPLDEQAAKDDPDRRNDELNLYYVVSTRGMKMLALNTMVISMMKHAKDRRAGLN
ncbi:UvrD-helicase domain-containing protein (plasmid) [Pseudomonas amygdali pv. lachrymans]|uniref:UvrD-helicase domain-containing protein n=1 Tax=Pseudomonas amygdali TaxID=47877 RepID=UPI0006B94610|nr:UvrD-helicase domain-containing protein [Pseudomonas amygdali]KPC02238.1 putative DNA helicase [Pseudomonas amygdali pv. lachrymans]RMM39310.1 hypothetical protein ALQ79_200402 [Pseudomonas amygdali pv. lachrymans]WIO61586.1 UvrD-helicase domain-containing protein [Pseudomonas amygdali pv. lachrymans]